MAALLTSYSGTEIDLLKTVGDPALYFDQLALEMTAIWDEDSKTSQALLK